MRKNYSFPIHKFAIICCGIYGNGMAKVGALAKLLAINGQILCIHLEHYLYWKLLFHPMAILCIEASKIFLLQCGKIFRVLSLSQA